MSALPSAGLVARHSPLSFVFNSSVEFYLPASEAELKS